MEVENDKLYDFFKDEKQSQPSTDFTKLVMERVDEIANKPFEVKPLITKKAWLRIIGIAAFIVLGSFLLELLAKSEEIQPIFDFSRLNIRDFKTSFRIGISVIILLSVLTLVDIIYRKVRNLV